MCGVHESAIVISSIFLAYFQNIPSDYTLIEIITTCELLHIHMPIPCLSALLSELGRFSTKPPRPCRIVAIAYACYSIIGSGSVCLRARRFESCHGRDFLIPEKGIFFFFFL